MKNPSAKSSRIKIAPGHAVLLLAFGLACSASGIEDDPANARKPGDDAELRYWLENMHVWHRFSPVEMSVAVGMPVPEVKAAIERFGLRPEDRPAWKKGDPLKVLPYPGGRHPRLEFLDGAVRPQRETKISIFTPWDPDSYFVYDVPEAIWSNLGLTYLAHTHVPTIWTEQNVEMEKLEWQRLKNGVLKHSRRLPNGIAFTSVVTPEPDAVKMEITLTNGTDEPLTGLRNQLCIMLGYAKGFGLHTMENRVYHHPYAACRNEDGTRWIITAWDPCHRVGGNDRCPCLHSNSLMDDCPPGETVGATGYTWFYEGKDIDAELRRLVEKTGWEIDPNMPVPGGRRPSPPKN